MAHRARAAAVVSGLLTAARMHRLDQRAILELNAHSLWTAGDNPGGFAAVMRVSPAEEREGCRSEVSGDARETV